MSATEIKEKLVKTIKSIDDERLLNEAYRFFQLELRQQDIFRLNDFQKGKINHAIEQVNYVEVLSEEKANQEIEKWFGETRGTIM